MGNTASQPTSETMKALTRVKAGEFVFKTDYPCPPAPAPGSGKVLVRVRAAAINPVDYKFGKGMLGPIVGLDFSGIVEVSETPEYKAGDEVFGKVRGSLAEKIVTSPKWLAKKPASLSWEAAAALVTTYVTAWDALHVWSGSAFRPGCNVLVIGASGGVGSATVQLALAQGAKKVVGVCSTKNVEFCQAQGCTAVVDYKKEKYGDVFGDAKLEDKFDVVFNTVTRDFDEAIKVIKPDSGWVVGINPKNSFEAMCYLSGAWRMTNPTRQTPFFLTNVTPANLAELGTLASTPGEDGKMKLAPVLAQTFALTAEDCKTAFDMLKSHRTVGKIVFKLPEEAAAAVASSSSVKVEAAEKAAPAAAATEEEDHESKA